MNDEDDNGSSEGDTDTNADPAVNDTTEVNSTVVDTTTTETNNNN